MGFWKTLPRGCSAKHHYVVYQPSHNVLSKRAERPWIKLDVFFATHEFWIHTKPPPERICRGIHVKLCADAFFDKQVSFLFCHFQRKVFSGFVFGRTCLSDSAIVQRFLCREFRIFVGFVLVLIVNSNNRCKINSEKKNHIDIGNFIVYQ